MMPLTDPASAVTALFIMGMIWLRTRMQYSRPGRGRLSVGRAGWLYFAAVLALLAAGWFAAPSMGAVVWPGVNATPSSMRVVWFLATYYVFIVVHRVLKSRGVEVFHSSQDDSGQGPGL